MSSCEESTLLNDTKTFGDWCLGKWTLDLYLHFYIYSFSKYVIDAILISEIGDVGYRQIVPHSQAPGLCFIMSPICLN